MSSVEMSTKVQEGSVQEGSSTTSTTSAKMEAKKTEEKGGVAQKKPEKPLLPKVAVEDSHEYLIALGLLGFVLLFPGIWGLPYYFQLLVYCGALTYIGAHLSITLIDRRRGEWEQEIPEEETVQGAQEGQQKEQAQVQNQRAEYSQTQQQAGFLSLKEAGYMPLVGSCTLLSMYLAFYFLGPVWVNFLMKFYITMVSAYALYSAVEPCKYFLFTVL